MIVGRGADVVALGDDDVAADLDHGEVLDFGIGADGGALANLEVPRHPDFDSSTDETGWPDLCAEEP